MGIVTANEVREKLEQWLAGELTAPEIHAWGESRFASDEWDPESRAVNEVLSELDRLDMNLVTVEDAPALLKALDSPNYLRILGDHYANRDVAARRRALASDPMYAPFCKGPHDV